MANVGLISFGECVWDDYGERKCLAGAPVNVAVRAMKLGCASLLVSAVGNDVLGDEMRKCLSSLGLEHLLLTTGYPTGHVKISLAGGIPSFTILKEYAFDHIMINPNDVAPAEALYFGTLASRHIDSKKTLQQLIPKAAKCFYDINLRPVLTDDQVREIVPHYFELADVIKMNDEEHAQIKRMGIDIGQFVQKGAELIISHGEKGATYLSRTKRLDAIAPRIKAVDTTGCGDALMGYIISAVLKKYAIPDIFQEAVIYASNAAAYQGALTDTF